MFTEATTVDFTTGRMVLVENGRVLKVLVNPDIVRLYKVGNEDVGSFEGLMKHLEPACLK